MGGGRRVHGALQAEPLPAGPRHGLAHRGQRAPAEPVLLRAGRAAPAAAVRHGRPHGQVLAAPHRAFPDRRPCRRRHQVAHAAEGEAAQGQGQEAQESGTGLQPEGRGRGVMGVLVKEDVSFKDLGVRPPRGVLLYGPPGTGKTLIAKGVAGEFDVPFFACSGSEFVEMYPGVAAQRLRDLFRQARENAPAVIFIDEIDAIAKRRTEGGELSEQDLGLFQLLVEMDGFGTYDDRVLVVGATNLKESLDPAMLRPGRLERHFYIDKPNRENRLAVLKVHAKKKLMVPHAGHPRLDDGDALLTWLAARTGGYNGAALENILNEATIVAVRRELAGVDEGVLRTLLEERGSGAPQGTAPESASKRRLARFHAAR